MVKFHVEEDLNGNVDVCFDDEISLQLHNCIASEIEYLVSEMPKKKRSAIGLKHTVSKYILKLISDGQIALNSNNCWVMRDGNSTI